MPSFSHTKVDPDQLSVAAGNIDDSLQTLERAFRTVDGLLRSSLLPSWKGPASDQFFAQYGIDEEMFSMQLAALRELNGQLREAAGLFDGADSKACDEVSKLRLA